MDTYMDTYMGCEFLLEIFNSIHSRDDVGKEKTI